MLSSTATFYVAGETAAEQTSDNNAYYNIDQLIECNLHYYFLLV